MMWQTIYIWPDDTWCLPDELEEMSHKSDDYYIQEIPDTYTSDQIEQFVYRFNKGNGCPTCEE